LSNVDSERQKIGNNAFGLLFPGGKTSATAPSPFFEMTVATPSIGD
jgi:hypothetical protein